MLINGKIRKEDSFWIVEIPELNLLTESKNRQESLELILWLIEEKYSFKKNNFHIEHLKEGSFQLSSKDLDVMQSLILKGLRNKEGLTIQEVADRLGFKGRSSYFKYESGKRSMSFDQFNRIVSVITGNQLVFKLQKN